MAINFLVPRIFLNQNNILEDIAMGDYFDIDCLSLIKELVKINNWDDWVEFEKKYFNSDLWPEKNEDVFFRELSIEPICVEGNIWKHVTDNYDLPDEYRFAFELFQNYAFKKLEHEAWLENRRSAGRYCVYCNLWTENSSFNHCPFCDNYMFSMY